MKLDIIDDTELNISCDVTINEKKYYYKPSNKTISYESISREPINIRFFKEDIWNTEQKFSSFLLIIYVFDWTFGNLSESDNLPFWIDHQLSLKTEDINACSQIFLSNIIKVNNDSLTRWSKYSIFQCIMISTILILIGIILSFVFKGWIKFAFIVCVGITSACAFKLMNSKRKNLVKVLKKFI